MAGQPTQNTLEKNRITLQEYKKKEKWETEEWRKVNREYTMAIGIMLKSETKVMTPNFFIFSKSLLINHRSVTAPRGTSFCMYFISSSKS